MSPNKSYYISPMMLSDYFTKVENSKTVFKNEKIREKEEVKKKQKEEKLKRQYSKDKPDIEPPKQVRYKITSSVRLLTLRHASSSNFN